MIRKHSIRNPLEPSAKGSHGFTLLELMISLFVFTVGILGVAVLQTQTVANHTYSDNSSRNNVVATDQIEEYLATNWDDERIKDDIERDWEQADQDPLVSITYRVKNYAAIPGAKLVRLTAEFKGNKYFARNNPSLDISVVKPCVGLKCSALDN